MAAFKSLHRSGGKYFKRISNSIITTEDEFNLFNLSFVHFRIKCQDLAKISTAQTVQSHLSAVNFTLNVVTRKFDGRDPL